MTTLITAATKGALARYSADHNDRFFDDGTVVLADVEGAEPAVDEVIFVRRPAIERGRVVPGKPRAYRVESVETREASAPHNGAHIVREVTSVTARFVPGVRP